jgi:hypothetical protein
MSNLRGDHCLCRACSEYFNSTGMFDRHRVGRYSPMERRCLSPLEMRAKGYLQNDSGFWIRSKRPEAAGTEPVGEAIA